MTQAEIKQMRRVAGAMVGWISVASLIGCGGVAHSLGGDAAGGSGGSENDSGLAFGGQAGGGKLGGSAGATGFGGKGGLLLDAGTGQGGYFAGAGGASQNGGANGAGGGVIVTGIEDASVQTTYVAPDAADSYLRGHLVGYAFPSGSSAVLFQWGGLDESGFVEFGSTTASPPTDPNVAYPDGDGSTVNQRVYEGARYPPANGEYGAQSLGIAPAEIWQSYCATLTPIAIRPGHYGCVPNGASGHDANGCYIDIAASSGTSDATTGVREAVDCGKLALCGGPANGCRCTATGCAFNKDGTVYLNLGLNPGETASTITIASVDNLNGNASVDVIWDSPPDH